MARAAAGAVRRHVRRRGWLRLPPRDDPDSAVKPAPYLSVYERLLAPLRFRRCRILELGIWGGDSLVMWRDSLPRATVVGLDLAPLPLELGPRVHLVAGDQGDAAVLDRIGAQYAPDGFDVIIDDAAHVGALSARSLQALFAQHLRPGGLYIIEDWGTGYVADWQDGAPLEHPVAAAELGAERAGHDAGMVGLVKRLVEHVAAGSTLRAVAPDRLSEPLDIVAMEVYDGMVVLRKRGA